MRARGILGALVGVSSVRRTSLVGMTLLLTILGLLGAGIAYWVDLADADRLLDDELEQIAFYAGAGLSPHSLRRHIYDRNHDILIQLRDPEGTLLYASDPSIAVSRQPVPGFATFQAEGETWRSFTATERDTTVQVSQRASLRLGLARRAALEAAIPVLVTIPLGWLVVGWGLSQITASLSRLAGAIAARGVESHTPMDLVTVPAELSPLVAAMNALIGRWQRSLEQQRQFLSDAAHELRTPLTGLRLQIDLLRSGRRDAAEIEAALPELARGAHLASSLIDQLLRMARYDADAMPLEQEDVDLAPLVLDCIADLVVLAESRSIDLGLVCSEPARVRAIARDLRVLVANLIENAVLHTPSGGVVDVGVRLQDGVARVDVADTGPGIPDDLLSRVFDRFFRVPNVASEGTGLGLAICLAIARRHGLSIKLANRAGGGLLASVSGAACGSPPESAAPLASGA